MYAASALPPYRLLFPKAVCQVYGWGVLSSAGRLAAQPLVHARPPPQGTFKEATAFNGDLSRWDVSAVRSTKSMDVRHVPSLHATCRPKAWPHLPIPLLSQAIFDNTLAFTDCNKFATLLAWSEHSQRLNETYRGWYRDFDQTCSPPPSPPAGPPPPPSPPPSPPPPVEALTVERGGDFSSSLLIVSSRTIGAPARLHVVGAHLLNQIVIDWTFGASKLILEAGSDDATLSAAGSRGVLLRLGEGAPPVTLAGFVLHGSVILNSTDANSRIDLRNCTWLAGMQPTRRALASHKGQNGLVVHAGRADLRRVEFRHFHASALIVDGPRADVTVSDGIFVYNQAERGAAAQVTAGTLTIVRGVIEHNVAEDAGSAFTVGGGGALLLADQTKLRNNTAPVIVRDADKSSTAIYSLPAPRAHWVSGAYTCSPDAIQPCNYEKNNYVRGLVVSSFPLSFSGDYPYACAAGAHGEGLTIDEQTSPQCSGLCPTGSAALEGSMSCSICLQGTYAANRGTAQCIPCPYRLSSPNGSASCSVCASGFFLVGESNSTGDLLGRPDAACPSCPDHAACRWSTTLKSLHVLPGHWRLSSNSRVMTACGGDNAVDRCIGGTYAGVDGEGYCGDRYTGPECQLCRGGRGLYLTQGRCVDCPEVGGKMAALAGLVVAILVAAVALYVALFHRLGQRVAALQPARRMVLWLLSYTTSIALPGKIKILFSFYGIITALDTTYDASMPQSYNDAVDAAFGWAKADQWFLSLVLPSECTPFASSSSTFRLWLLVKGLTPLLIVLLVTLGRIAIKCAQFGCSRQSLVAGVFAAMPLALITSFLFVPSVSTTIFQSFLCTEYQFDGSDEKSISSYSYLSSDLRVRCSEGGHNDAEHDAIKSIAAVLICIWPVGMVALYAIALTPARASLLARIHTPLVRGTRFLHNEYTVECFYWEIIELVRRTFLVGWVLFIFSSEQAFLRLVVALLLSVVSFALLLIIRPYRRPEDNLFAGSCQLVLVITFIGAGYVRTFEQIEATSGAAAVQRIMVFPSTSAIAMPLLALTMMMAILMLLIMTVIIHKEGHQAEIRLESSGAPPEMTLLPWQRWHLFLSHTWASAQEYLP